MAIRLPLEILTAILKELDDVRDLCHVRMACHTLCAAATPIAFRTLSVITTRASAQNLGRLFDLPDIAAHVREVSYHDTGADRRGRALNYVRSNAIHELARSFSRIHQLPHLETINLMLYPLQDNRVNFDNGGRLALQASILGALATSFEVRIPPKLASFLLHNLRTSDLPPLESPPFQNFLTNLRRLQLSVLFDSFPDDRTFSSRCYPFWGKLFPSTILAPAQHALTDLTLCSDVNFGASSGLSFNGLHFPHLCSLSLRHLVLEASVGLEPFILRHATSLARLELIACMLPAGLVSYPLPWTPPPPSSDRCWDSVWDSFAAELNTLVALHVHGQECGYVSACFGLSYVCDGARESRDAADVAALQRFRAVVAARSEEV